MKQKIVFLFVLLFVLSINGKSQTDTELYRWLSSIPDLEVKQIKHLIQCLPRLMKL